MGEVKKAVIPAAGMGTRFLPATKALPKEMLPLIDTPVIQYVVEEAISSGIEDIIIVTGRGKRAIEDYFDQAMELEYFLKKTDQKALLERVRRISGLANIHYIRQKEPLGLGHAIYQARMHLGRESFAVLLGDDIFRGPVPATRQLMEYHHQKGGNVLALAPVPDCDLSKYGIIRPQKLAKGVYNILELVEKPVKQQAPSNLAIMGRYVLEPEVLDLLEHTPPGHNGEIQLTDALQAMTNDRQLHGVEVESKRYDVGDTLGYLQAIVDFALADPRLGEQFRVYLQSLKIGKG